MQPHQPLFNHKCHVSTLKKKKEKKRAPYIGSMARLESREIKQDLLDLILCYISGFTYPKNKNENMPRFADH